MPASYVRRQTVKGAERYVTDELKQFEDKVLNSESLSVEREYEIFQALRTAVAAELPRVLRHPARRAEIGNGRIRSFDLRGQAGLEGARSLGARKPRARKKKGEE